VVSRKRGKHKVLRTS